MQRSRPRSALAGIGVVIGLIAVACGTSAEVAAPGPGIEASPGQGELSDDGLELRTVTDAESGGTGASREADGARPSPPTLSPAGRQAAEAAAAEGPTSTTTTVATTAAPTTVVTTAEAPPSSDTTTTVAPTTTTSAPPPEETSTTTPPQETSTSTAPPDTTTTTVGSGPDLDVGEAQSFVRLNELRSGLGLDALQRDGEMDAFARDWSRQMAESGQFEHSSGPYGENIAFTSNTRLTAAEAADLFHQLWVDSPGHYANMTNDRYTKAGIGLYLTERGWYGTHVFSF